MRISAGSLLPFSGGLWYAQGHVGSPVCASLFSLASSRVKFVGCSGSVLRNGQLSDGEVFLALLSVSVWQRRDVMVMTAEYKTRGALEVNE